MLKLVQITSLSIALIQDSLGSAVITSLFGAVIISLFFIALIQVSIVL